MVTPFALWWNGRCKQVCKTTTGVHYTTPNIPYGVQHVAVHVLHHADECLRNSGEPCELGLVAVEGKQGFASVAEDEDVQELVVPLGIICRSGYLAYEELGDVWQC